MTCLLTSVRSSAQWGSKTVPAYRNRPSHRGRKRRFARIVRYTVLVPLQLQSSDMCAHMPTLRLAAAAEAPCARGRDAPRSSLPATRTALPAPRSLPPSLPPLASQPPPVDIAFLVTAALPYPLDLVRGTLATACCRCCRRHRPVLIRGFVSRCRQDGSPALPRRLVRPAACTLAA